VLFFLVLEAGAAFAVFGNAAFFVLSKGLAVCFFAMGFFVFVPAMFVTRLYLKGIIGKGLRVLFSFRISNDTVITLVPFGFSMESPVPVVVFQRSVNIFLSPSLTAACK